jgi:protein-tyrosine-phosphatase
MSETVILVLCSGNIGRSPLAEVFIKEGLASRLGVPIAELPGAGVAVISAGTDAPEGHPASSRGIAFAAERGLDLNNHTATRLTATEVRLSDRIFAMDRSQMDAVAELAPEAIAKTELLAGEGHEIPDPHHGSDDFFYDVADRVERAVASRLDELVALIRA